MDLRFGPWRPRLVAWAGLGVIFDGLVDAETGAAGPDDYLAQVLITAKHAPTLFALVDRVGLVVCRDRSREDASYREVRGRSSRGRLSQGEYYHHDGCSGPVKPRVVEIRCPIQAVERKISTAVAPFPAVLHAQLLGLPVALQGDPELAAWRARVAANDLALADCDNAQGVLNRAVRRQLSAVAARDYMRAVDRSVGAFCEPWTMGESRFIANNNPVQTMQHRRAYPDDHTSGTSNGHLVKRWPAEMTFSPE